MPTLIVNNIKYETDEQKANLFASNLSETFSSITNQNFDNEFKSKVEKTIENTDFSKHAFNKKDLLDIKDLNLAIQQQNKRSAYGEDKVHNRMLLNTHQEFRKIILYLYNDNKTSNNCSRMEILRVYCLLLSIIYPCFSIANLELLEKIQFRCLKI